MESRYSKFTSLITNINKSINRIKNEEMQQFGLRSTHVSCLFYLNKNNEGLTASELCMLCEEDKGAISRTLDFLEEEGYITYNLDQDKRKYRAKVFLTKKGQDVSENIIDITEKAVDIGSNGLDDKRRDIMYKSLEIISENLSKYCDNKEK